MQNTEAEVGTKGGARYRGIVKSVDASGPVAVVLSGAVRLDAVTSHGNGARPTPTEVVIKAEDLVDLFAAKVDLTRAPSVASPAPANRGQGSSAWKTDTDISGALPARERVLQAWQPPQENEGFSIEDEAVSTSKIGASGKKWDQFAANEKLFGVKSQWDEDVYTHKLDTSRPDFAKRQAEAEKIAREIESSSSTNAHVLEERGVAIDDSGLTEEDKYSGVQRNPNAWVPPARRPVANLPAPRAAPADPAIISSQLAKPGTSGHKTVASVANTPRQVSKEGTKSGELVTVSSGSKGTKPIEADIMAKFKQFATNERDRLSVKKASTVNKAKDGRLQDLLAFSKDFKLNTPVPEDLIPILAKDKAKQDAILQKAASSASSSPVGHSPSSPHTNRSETKLPDTLRARIDRAHQVPPSTPSPLMKEQTAEIKKLKPSAAEFKPFNPAASSFTPSAGQRIQPPAASPALSSSSSQQRHAPFTAEAPTFFPRRPKPLSERSPILEHFNPFKTFAAKNPDSTVDIETPLKVDPAWPSDNTTSISDPPQDSRRPSHFEDQFVAGPPQFVPNSSPQMMYVGALPQSPGFQQLQQQHQQHQQQQQQQQQGYYASKPQPYLPGPPGQFSSYQGGPGFVPPQYMYQGIQGYNRAIQPQMMPVTYPGQPFNSFNPSSECHCYRT